MLHNGNESDKTGFRTRFWQNSLPVAEKPQSSFKQLIRYAFVGIVSNLVGYIVYFLITYLGATPKITMTILYGLGASMGYVGNRNFTFAHKGSFLGSGFRYFIAHFFGYFINLIIMIIFADLFGYAHQWVQVTAIFVVAGFLFIAFKIFVFTNFKALNLEKL